MNLVLWIMTMRVKITADIWCLKVNDIPCGSDGKESVCSAGDLGSISGLGRSFGEGNVLMNMFQVPPPGLDTRDASDKARPSQDLTVLWMTKKKREGTGE